MVKYLEKLAKNEYMFLNTPGEPGKLKKIIYLISSTVLGVILSFIVHAFIEMRYLDWAESRGLIVAFYNGCALPPVLQVGLLLFGAVAGFFLGRFWWQKVYSKKAKPRP